MGSVKCVSFVNWVIIHCWMTARLHGVNEPCNRLVDIRCTAIQRRTSAGRCYSGTTVSTLGRQSDMHGESKARVLVYYKMNQMKRTNKASTVHRERAFSYSLYTSESKQLRFVIKITVCRQRILLQETCKAVFSQPTNCCNTFAQLSSDALLYTRSIYIHVNS